MNFIPTKEMRYANALRNFLQKRGIKDKEKQILSLFLYEAVFCKTTYEMTVDIEDITDAIFGALFIIATRKGKKIETQKGRGDNVKINVKLYEILLSAIVFEAEEKIFVTADFFEHFISIKFLGNFRNNLYKKVAALMGGVCLKDVKTGKNAVFIPVNKSIEKAKKYKSEIDLIRCQNSAIYLLSEML